MADDFIEVPPSVFRDAAAGVLGDPAVVAALRAGLADSRAMWTQQRPVHIDGGGARTEKDFVALMNKLSSQNHAAIEAQLWRYFQPMLFTFYANHLWNLMYKQAAFNVLYINILRQIHDRLSDEDKGRLKALMLSHFETYFRGFTDSFAPMVLPPGDDYDEFCDAVKLKKQSLGKAAALCAAISAELVEEPCDGVLSRLLASMPRSEDGPDKLAIWTEHTEACLRELRWSPPQVAGLASAAVRAVEERGPHLPPKARFKLEGLRDHLVQPPLPAAAAGAAPSGDARVTSARPAPPGGWPKSDDWREAKRGGRGRGRR